MCTTSSALDQQRQYIDELHATPLPCPKCGTRFSMSGNEFGEEKRPSNGAHDPMAKCPQCGIIWNLALSLTGEYFWAVERELDRITPLAVDAYYKLRAEETSLVHREGRIG